MAIKDSQRSTVFSSFLAAASIPAKNRSLMPTLMSEQHSSGLSETQLFVRVFAIRLSSIGRKQAILIRLKKGDTVIKSPSHP
jgi:hypothetical protein